MLRGAAGRACFGVVVRAGDADAGGILVQLRGRDGFSVLSQATTAGGTPVWLRATGPTAVDEATAEAYVARQIGRDPDLWVLEFESADRTLPFPGHISD